MAKWTAFPYDNADYLYDAAALKKKWARLHAGDAEPLPKDDKVAAAWALFHAGEFQKATEAGLKADPGNSLYWRFPMRRLGSEEVRDSMLAVSGSLNETMYGPSVYPKIPKEVLAGQSVPGQGWPTTTGFEGVRISNTFSP